jgi:hypothetical protein
MSQQAQNQSVTSQSTTPHPTPPQPTNNKPDAFARLAEAVDGALKRLNHPKSAKSSAPKGTRPSPPASVSQAKNYLRATRPPKFLNPHRSLERHARKCAICHHPEREMIEELFVRWHSPQAIANRFHDYDAINWASIYRHAYALGLDVVRRRNLGCVFERVLDNAADATPTAAGVVAAARALGCVGEDGRWVEPEKRITMTTIVRKDDPSALTSTDPESAESGVQPFGNSGTGSQPVRANPAPPLQNQGERDQAARHRGIPIPASLPPCLSASSSREIRPALNSHRTKDKRVSNR